MRRTLSILAVVVVAALIAWGVQATETHHHAVGVCSYDADDHGCNGHGPDNDGNR